MVAVLRANDIDLSPGVTYRLDRPSDFFSLDTYTGQLILLKRPDDDGGQKSPGISGGLGDAAAAEMTLSAVASDSVHEARTQVKVSDCPLLCAVQRAIQFVDYFLFTLFGSSCVRCPTS